MVVLVLVSVGMVLPGATEAFNCCFRPPNISALGPPPRPPGINFDLRCNGSGKFILYFIYLMVLHFYSILYILLSYV